MPPCTEIKAGPFDSLEAEARRALDDACACAKARYACVESVFGRDGTRIVSR